MNDKGHNVTVRVDGYTRVCLTAIAVLLTAIVIGLWTEIPDPSGAGAAEPFLNTGAQRADIKKVQEETNNKLDKLITLLKSGEVKVQMVGGTPGATGKGATNVVSGKKKK